MVRGERNIQLQCKHSHSEVLHCIALYYTVLHCIAWHYIALHNTISLYGIVLYYTQTHTKKTGHCIDTH